MVAVRGSIMKSSPGAGVIIDEGLKKSAIAKIEAGRYIADVKWVTIDCCRDVVEHHHICVQSRDCDVAWLSKINPK